MVHIQKIENTFFFLQLGVSCSCFGLRQEEKKHKLVEDHPMNIHIKISCNWLSDFREEYLNVKVDGSKVMTISRMTL